MAKSSRASTRKRNNAVLRSKVFGPATDARTERLSAKLQELASKPKAEEEIAMDVDAQADSKEESSASAEAVDEEMVVDAQTSKRKTKAKSSTSRNPSRVSKHRVTKPKKARNNVIFPDLQARKQRPKERRAQGKR